MTRVSCVWKDVQTGQRVCLVNTPHRCTLGNHVTRKPDTDRVTLRDAVLSAWLAAWAVVGLYALLALR